MAMNYQNFASLGVNLNRQKYGPLDISNVFTSDADLKYYLTKGTFTEGVSEYWYKNANEKIVPYPYEGQVLATVIDGVVNVYTLALDAEGNFVTQEIAGKIEVDGTTITKDAEGKLSIVAPVSPDSTKTYNFAYANGVYSWVEVDTATAAGQAQAITGLQERTTALETTINGKAAVGSEGDEGYVPAVVGLSDKVAQNTSTIAAEAQAREDGDKNLSDRIGTTEDGSDKATVYGAIAKALEEAKQYAADNDADTAYDDTALVGRITTIETAINDETSDLNKAIAANTAAITAEKERAESAEAQVLIDAKAYTADELSGIKVAIEQRESVDFIVLKNKAGTEIASVDASKFVQDSFLDDVAYDSITGKITFTWVMGDGSTKTDEVAVADFVQTYVAGSGLTLTGNEFSVDTSIIATVEALNAVKATAEAAQTATQVETAISSAIEAENLAQYAKANEVVANTTFDEFQASNTEAIADAKKAGTDAAAALTSHIEEANTAIADAKKAGTDAAAALDSYKTEVTTALDTKVENATIVHAVAADEASGTEAIPEGVTKEGTTLKIVVDAPTRAETTQMIADKVAAVTGGESAAAVKLLVEAEAERSKAKDDAHDAAIAEAKAQADKGVEDAATVAAELATAKGSIADNAREIGVTKDQISSVNNTLTEKITALENKDTTIEGNITALQTTVGGHTTTITEHGTKISALENKNIEFASLIQANTDKFTSYSTTEQMNTAIGDAIAAIDYKDYAKKADVEATYAKAADVYTKTDADATFMTQDEVDSRINTLIIAADPEGGKTISDIQNLVKYVDENAGEITELIATTEANTAKLADIDGTVKAYVDTAVAAATPKISEEFELAADGTMSIKSIDISKITQSATTVLILNGGNAKQ